MSKPTRGPWHRSTDGEQIILLDDTGLNRHIAYFPLHSMPGGEQQANAILAQSAPDLLAACEAAMRITALWCPAGPCEPQHEEEFAALELMRANFQAAIAKATQ